MLAIYYSWDPFTTFLDIRLTYYLIFGYPAIGSSRTFVSVSGFWPNYITYVCKDIIVIKDEYRRSLEFLQETVTFQPFSKGTCQLSRDLPSEGELCYAWTLFGFSLTAKENINMTLSRFKCPNSSEVQNIPSFQKITWNMFFVKRNLKKPILASNPDTVGSSGSSTKNSLMKRSHFELIHNHEE